MELDLLRTMTRARLDDQASGRLWSDDEIDVAINHSYFDAAFRANLLREEFDDRLALITTQADLAVYLLHSSFYFVESLYHEGRGGEISIYDATGIRRTFGDNWKNLRASYSQSATVERLASGRLQLRLIGTPTIAGAVRVVGYRYPYEKLESGSDEPEFAEHFHLPLIYGATSLLYGKRDSDAFDAARQQSEGQLFTEAFGPVRRADRWCKHVDIGGDRIKMDPLWAPSRAGRHTRSRW